MSQIKMILGALILGLFISLEVTDANPVALSEWSGSDVTKASEELDQELRDRLTVIEKELESIAKAVNENADKAEERLRKEAEESGLARTQRSVPSLPLVDQENSSDLEDNEIEVEALEASEDVAETVPSVSIPESANAKEPSTVTEAKDVSKPSSDGEQGKPADGNLDEPSQPVDNLDLLTKPRVPEKVRKAAAQKAKKLQQQKKKKQIGLGAKGNGNKKVNKNKQQQKKRVQKGLSEPGCKKGKKDADEEDEGEESDEEEEEEVKPQKKKAKAVKKAANGKKKRKQQGLSAGKGRGLTQKEINKLCTRRRDLFNTVEDVAVSRQLADQIAKLSESFQLLKEAVKIARPTIVKNNT